MAILLRMPEVAASSVEAVLQSWGVAENTAFPEHATLATIETEKALVDVEAQAPGTLVKHLVEVGSSVAVGTPIALIAAPGEHVDDIAATLAELGIAPPPATPVAVPVAATVAPPAISPFTPQPTWAVADELPAAQVAPPAPPAPVPALEQAVAPAATPASAPVAEARPATVSFAPPPPPPPAPTPEPGPVPSEPPVVVAPPTEESAPDDHESANEIAGAGLVDRVFASPLARRLAREAGIDYESLDGSGPDGRIVRRDVEMAIAQRDLVRQREQAAERRLAAQMAQASEFAHAATSPPPEPVPATTLQASQPEVVAAGATAISNAKKPSIVAGVATDIPHTRMRRAIAKRLTLSKQTVPHFYVRGTCRVDSLLAARAELNAVSPTRISVNDFIVKAVGRAHMLVPAMNVNWTDDSVRSFSSVDVAVAVSTDGGLVTPVLRAVEQTPIAEVAAQTKDFATRARLGQLKQDEIEGGTISVSNLGMYGTEEFAAIINPPQAAILAVGAAKPSPIAKDGKVEVATVLRVTLSADHRCVDGALAAEWLQVFIGLVENPIQILA